MELSQILMPVRAWWFLRIAKNAAIPPDVGRHLRDLRNRNQLALDEVERKRQQIITHGAASNRTISTEAALKHVFELRAAYVGTNREEDVAELDRFIEAFREKHGPQIPVAEAYDILKELEVRFGRFE